jgi:hypothetical protein
LKDLEESGEKWQKYPVLKIDLNAKEYTKVEHLKTILNNHKNVGAKI